MTGREPHFRNYLLFYWPIGKKSCYLLIYKQYYMHNFFSEIRASDAMFS
jgi:hypothetical protein